MTGNRLMPNSTRKTESDSLPKLSIKFPNLLNYTNYRQFLQDYYSAHKRADPKFSLRFFAKKANFPSHGLLKYLMEGKRNLSQKSLTKIVAALKLDANQTQYFENLVYFNQARTSDEKKFFYEKLMRLPGKTRFRKLESSQLQIFRHWYTIAIREMLNLKGFRNNPRWIAEQLLTMVEPSQVQESLELLVASGMIKKTANGYKSADPDITTDDEVKSFLVKDYHAQLLKLAALAQDEIPGPERDISSVCFPIRESDLPNLKKQVQLMRKELRGFEAESGKGDRIVQVNIQLFPVTKGTR